MRKAGRLFEIIQILRLARHPVTAAEIAARLEVTPRSVYRDIVVLQGMRVPIEGERGIGYILRPGFDLSDPSRWDIPRLIPIDQQVFEELSGLMAQQKLVKRKRGAAKKKPLAQA